MHSKMENAGFSMKLIGSKYVYTKNKISVIFHVNNKYEVDNFQIIIETTNENDTFFRF
ncbi:MAG TPA: hypothetical protein VJ962_05005 [Clostridia bacterium]|nr:hypothetical protein [Clostridia bacterium]